LSKAASGSRRRPARSSPMIVTSIATLTAENDSAAPPKPVGLGSTRLSSVPAAIPASAGTTTTETRTSRLRSGRRCHWWVEGPTSGVGGTVTSAMCSSPAGPRPAMTSRNGSGQSLRHRFSRESRLSGADRRSVAGGSPARRSGKDTEAAALILP
jgi:hypothetical protein